MAESEIFGIFFNEKFDISMEERIEAGFIIEHLRKFPRITNDYTYIVDLTCNKIVYVSKGLCFLCNRPEEDLKKELYKLHREFFSPKDSEKIEKLRIQWHKLLTTKNNLLEEDFCLGFNFHLAIDGHTRLFHYNASPFMRTREGNIWMMLCTLTQSSQKDTGYATLHIKDRKQYFEYDFTFNKWIEKEMPYLTKTEEEILALSAQGFTEIEIAARINKSHNTLKTYKRNLFRKLQVDNITEAMMFCLNHALI